jgi:hypothetical protein
MSTKTTFKRVALVTVAALGFGVLTSISPVSATTTGAKINTVATLTTTTTTLSARVNNQVQFNVAGTLATTVGSTAAFPVARFAAAITEQPSGSAAYATLVSSGSAINSKLAYAVSGGSAFAGTTAATAAVTHSQTSADPAEIKYLGSRANSSFPCPRSLWAQDNGETT